MRRIKAVIAYDGSRFYGSQYQNDRRTVIGELKIALSSFGAEPKIVGSGRTDRGVHALNQVMHFDIDLPIECEKLKVVLNRALQKRDANDIVIKNLVDTDGLFHARFSAKKRSYRYIIKEGIENPFMTKFAHFEKNINFELLKKAISIFVGEHDFKYFSKNESEKKSTIREIKRAYLYRYRGFYVFYFEANAFLRTQIRLMMGSLISLNRGQIELEQIKSQLKKEQIFHREPLKPNGLYLSKIHY